MTVLVLVVVASAAIVNTRLATSHVTYLAKSIDLGIGHRCEVVLQSVLSYVGVVFASHVLRNMLPCRVWHGHMGLSKAASMVMHVLSSGDKVLIPCHLWV